MTVSPLAQVLREIRHGRVALFERRIHSAIMSRDCAFSWLKEGWLALPAPLPSGLMKVRDLAAWDRRRQHRWRRLLFVQRQYDAFAYWTQMALMAVVNARMQIPRNVFANSTPGLEN